MVNLLRKSINFLKEDLFRVFTYTAFSTLVKMLTGLVSVKFIAILIGPSGIALLGQLNNFSSIILIIASAGINNGVIKYLAEQKDFAKELGKLLSTALLITLIASTITGLFVFTFADYFSKLIFIDPTFNYVFKIFGLTIVLYALNTLLISILNGLKEFRLFVIVNIIGSIVGLIFTLTLVYFWRINGALISLVTFQSVVFAISLLLIRKSNWLRIKYFNKGIDLHILKRYGNYSLMTLVTASTAPIAQLILRSYIIDTISPDHAGWWEAMNRISNMYLLVITTSFSVYYLPKLSEITDSENLRQEILKGFKFIVPTLLLGFIVLYFSRFLLIKLLFTKEFVGMESLFIWQLVGDFFKITSWLLAYIMVAKAMTKTFIISEILITLFFLSVAYLMLNRFGIIGVTQAYALNYLVYLIIMTFIFRKIIFLKKSVDV
jgi:PST family polysaccharide transporter